MSLVVFQNEESNFPYQLIFSSSAIANFLSANAEVVLKNFAIKSVLQKREHMQTKDGTL